jgi:hypothetical protein
MRYKLKRFLIVIKIFHKFLRTLCNSLPGVEFYLAPTTTRTTPVWFSTAQASISRLIQQLVQDIRPRLTFLPAFLYDHSSLDPDGVHFLPTPGQHYVMYLIDSSRYGITPHNVVQILYLFSMFNNDILAYRDHTWALRIVV